MENVNEIFIPFDLWRFYYILWSFAINFPHFGVLYQEKSGNLAWSSEFERVETFPT
jgi:hypothetical protein